MGSPVVVEILDRSNRVQHRQRVETLPITIGRAYSNTVIVDDRYVSPEHLRIIEESDGTLTAEDTGSLNGTYDTATLQRVSRLRLTPDTRLRLGNTFVRVRPAAYDVESALPHALGTSWFRTPWHALAALFGCLLYLIIQQYLSTVQTQQLLARLGQWVPYVFAVLVWAGAWSLASRVLQHRFHFLEHAATIVTAAVALSMLDVATDLFAFAFMADRSGAIIAWIGTVVIVTVLLYGHIRLCSTDNTMRLLVRAAVAAGVIVGLQAFAGYASDTQVTEVPGLLKPPAFRLVSGRSPTDFAKDTVDVKDEVDALITERGED